MTKIYIAALFAFCSLQLNAQLANGLIAYYPFTNGSTANASGTTFSTIFAQNTSPTANVMGTSNMALAFSGNSPQLWVNTHDLIDFGLTTSFSFITDFRSGSSAQQEFFRDLLTNGRGWRIGFYNNAGYVTFEAGAGSTAISVHTTAIFNDLQWHQVALLVDKVNLTIEIYVDNVLQPLAGTVCGMQVSGTSASIATCNFNANEDNTQLTTFGEDMVGSMDEIRLYGRLLSLQDVGAAHALSFGGPTGINEQGELQVIDRYDTQLGLLDIAGLAANRTAQVSVIAQDGRVVSQQAITGPRVLVELSAMASGMYTVRIQQGQLSWTGRYLWSN